ncbi:MAG TPA: hypothetical protein VL285_25465 [Bryobacteraceae bacterium]|jgi:hypothetical protein|nr:hypothetical protein [Bryobacteraceae bacterium]
MRLSNRLLTCALLGGFALAASMPDVQAVYLLPMSGGLDQYLANRLTAAGLFRVVTDPKLADAVFTDQLGAAFEQKLLDLYPPPQTKAKQDDADKNGQAPPRISTFGHGRGNLFLVDLKSRAVIWSVYEKPTRTAPETLDRTAGRIVEQIKKQQKPKP